MIMVLSLHLLKIIQKFYMLHMNIHFNNTKLHAHHEKISLRPLLTILSHDRRLRNRHEQNALTFTYSTLI